MATEDPPANAAQLASPAYRLPALDPDFLLGPSMRGVRFLLEFAKADEALKAWGVRSTVIVFGSARIPAPEQAKAELGAAKDKETRARASRRMGLSRYYTEARDFGRIVSERGGALCDDGDLRDNVIATGGGPGIMEAANRGAADAGAPSIGFNIALPHEQEPNTWSTPELTFRFHYFAMRKMHFAMRANALVAFPGGFGTLDELFEVLTLIQTATIRHTPVILVGDGEWDGLTAWLRERPLADGRIDPSDMELLQVVSDPPTVLEIVEREHARQLAEGHPARRGP